MAEPQGAAPPTDPTVQDLIRQAAQKHGVPPELALAVGEQESGFNPTVTGPKLPSGESAVGTFQILPSTAKGLGIDPTDPHQNIEGGVKYLRQLLDQHQGDLTKVLSSYGGVKTDTKYVPGVLARMSKFQTSATEPPAAPAVAARQPGQTGEDAPGAAPPAPPESWSAWATRHGKAMLQQFDPRNPEGRRNLAGGMGAAIGGTLASPTAAVSGPAGPALGATLGAMVGGGLVSGGEAAIRYATGQPALGAPPPKPGEPPPHQPTSVGDVVQAAGAGATEQGLYEMGGHALMWPVKAAGRAAIGTRVGRYAAEGLSQAKVATLGRLNAALDAAQAGLRGTKVAVKQGQAGMEASTRRLVGRAAQDARAGVQTAQAAGEAGEAAARQPYEQLVGAPPPSAAKAGRAANQVIQQGGAAEARNMAGRAVEEAAATGPAVDLKPLKAEAQRILEQEIKPSAEAFPRRSAEAMGEEDLKSLAASANLKTEDMQALVAKAKAGGPGSAAAANLKTIQDQAADFARTSPEGQLAAAQTEAAKETLKHPAMGVLNRILNAEDSVSFADAHAFKRELDEAVGTAWDRSVKSRVTNLTKHLRGTLREALAGHAPYDRATAAYQAVAPLYTQGMAPKLRRLATEEPESIVRLLNPAQPTKAKMLVDLLTQQAEAGGGGAEGQAALEAVQSAWVHQKLIQGGIETLGDRLQKLPPAFKEAFLSDPKAQKVLDNLQLIHTAYQTAVQQGERGVATAREAGQQGVEAARASREGVLSQQRQFGAGMVEQATAHKIGAQRALTAGKKAAAGEAAEFAQSSLGPRMKAGAGQQFVRDALLAAALGPQKFYGAVSLGRLLKGPTADHLVRWASYSPSGTRLLVKAITSDRWAQALADLARSSGVLAEPTNLMEGRPPSPAAFPSPGPVGTPPPAGRVAQSPTASR